MAEIRFKGNITHTNAPTPPVGTPAPDFTGVKRDLTELSLSSLKGRKVIINIFPSLDTPVCATTVRHFNKEAAALKNTVVLAVSKDLPFAQERFCTVEGIDNVVALSTFRNSSFEDHYGMLLVDGPLKGLLARGVIIVNEAGKIIYSELVSDIAEEPKYEAVFASLA